MSHLRSLDFMYSSTLGSETDVEHYSDIDECGVSWSRGV